MRIVPTLRAISSLVLLAIAWELASRLSLIDSRFFPPLSQVIASTLSELRAGTLAAALMATIGTAMAGLSAATLIGASCGVLLGVAPKARDYGMPIAEVLRPIPSVALIPVFLLLFGIGFQTVFWTVFLGCLWPILMASLYGVRQIDEMLLQVADSLHLPKSSVLTKIVLPAALPSIIGGIRIAVAVSLISTVTCEMVLGFRGIGAYILENERSFRFAEMYGGIVMLSVSGLIINRIFVKLERTLIFWADEKSLA